jgi:hypothetical protein
MRTRVLLKFAKVLMVSRLRSTRRSYLTNGITSRPVIIGVIGAVLFAIGLGLGWETVRILTSSGTNPAAIGQIIFTIYGGIPIFLVGFFFSMGLLWELNASTEAETTDAINWLPITPSEYVIASTLSTSYTYSPLVAVAIGYALPLGFLTGNGSAFLLLIGISIVSTFIGSVGVEILRSVLARASTAFSKVGGKTVVIIRILGVVVILVFTQAMFSGFLVVRLISALVGDIAATTAVPVFWPTLSITSLLDSDLPSAGAYALLSVGFFFLLAYIALFLRARFWIAAPPSLHFSSSGSLSGASKLRWFGLSNLSAALVRRELRSATRRKEVVRLMAIPLILPVMVLFPVVFSPAPSTTATPLASANPLLLAAPLMFGVGLGALFLGLTSIGQEGGRLWNIGSLPIGERMVVKTKLMFTSIIAMAGLVLGLTLAVLIFGLSLLDAGIFAAVGLTVVLAESSLGIAIGSRYADFSEGPRPRFVTMKGSIIGSILGILLMGLMSAAFVLMLLISIQIVGLTTSLEAIGSLPFLATALVGLIFSRLGYRFAIGPVSRILNEIPT